MTDYNDIPVITTRDSFGNVLTYKEPSGYSYEYTRDSLGRVLTYKNNEGYWWNYTRDSSGTALTFRDSDGQYCEFIAHDGYYGLRYEGGRYKAGCRDFSYDEAIKHWNDRLTSHLSDTHNRAKLFLEAIEKNELH